MTIEEHPFQEGDTVLVRPEVEHPDLEYDLGGWQGRVVDITTDNIFGELVEVEWDSITLNNMPRDYIEICDREGLDWTRTQLIPAALLPAPARDMPADATRVAEELSDRYESAGYDDEEKPQILLEEQEARIRMILEGTEDETEALQAWADSLRRNLHFPFAAEVTEFQVQGPLQQEDIVEVRRFSLVDDEHGVLVAVEHEARHYDFPLAALKVRDESSANHQVVDDYITWFHNR